MEGRKRKRKWIVVLSGLVLAALITQKPFAEKVIAPYILIMVTTPMIALVPFLRTRGYSSLPVHFLGKAATAGLLYAFPLLLLGDDTGTVAGLARVFGWAFAIWGVGLYCWAGLLYVWQVRRLMTTVPPVKAR